MNAQSPPSIQLGQKRLNWRRISNFLFYNLVAWGLLCAFVALAVYSEDLRAGEKAQFGTIFFNWVAAACVLAPLFWILYFSAVRWEAYLNHPKLLILAYGLSFLFIIPWHIFHALFSLIWAKSSVTFVKLVLAYEDAVCLFRVCAITVIFGAVLGLRLWQQNQVRILALRDEQEQKLRLSLKLEQQNLATLKAQLEPHFMFNSLNALSGLVRTSHTENALAAIEKLSELLRYSLASSEKTWVTMNEEIQFLNDYLSLQKLRYGSRLQIRMEGLTEEVLAFTCPPFILQPLVENALRHELDCYKGSSDILLNFTVDDAHLFFQISNAVHPEFTVKSGFGLGLRTLKARLESLYGELASFTTYTQDNRFFVEMRLPYDS